MHSSLFFPIVFILTRTCFLEDPNQSKNGLFTQCLGRSYPNAQFNVVYAVLGQMVSFLPGSHISIDTTSQDFVILTLFLWQIVSWFPFFSCTRLHIRIPIVGESSRLPFIHILFMRRKFYSESIFSRVAISGTNSPVVMLPRTLHT